MLRHTADNRLFNMILLFTIIGEFLLPFVLEQFYAEYDGRMMVMSVLGNPQSPVRLIYNLWLIWLGCFLVFTAWVYFERARVEFPVLSVFLLLSIGIFAVGAGILSGVFSVNESREVVTLASGIHGVSAAIGFMALLFFPLLDGMVSFQRKDMIRGAVSIIAFILALIFFTCFVMGDKEQFQNTILKYEGLWERLTLLCLYIPLIHRAMGSLFV